MMPALLISVGSVAFMSLIYAELMFLSLAISKKDEEV